MRTEYRFHPAEHGIFVEVYLPKKAAFQGTLYQALTEGFSRDRVREHLLSRRADVERFFGPSDYTARYEERAHNLRQVFAGYSMYEVDGVYYQGEGEPVAEERSQVIRILFRPELQVETSKLPDGLRRAVQREYIRFPEEKERFLDHFLSANPSLDPEQVEQVRAMVQDLRDWEAEVALFLFGYVVFNLCERIKELRGEDLEQDEIWVTSLWNLAVNSVTRVKIDGGGAE